MTQSYITSGSLLPDSFSCPYCGVYSMMKWSNVIKSINFPEHSVTTAELSMIRGYYNNFFNGVKFIELFPASSIAVATCPKCYKQSIWIDQKMVYPSPIPMEPHPDMPEECKKTFIEAQLVARHSTRAACALLRVCLEQLVIHVGGKGKDLNDKIKSLNLPGDIKELSDACRIIGNQSAHPSLLCFEDDDNDDLPNTISSLVNVLVGYLISPRKKAKEALTRVKQQSFHDNSKRP